MTRENPWTPEHDAILTELWPTNSGTAIGARLNRTKSSVISRAHRLKLPAKASPIVRRLGPKPATLTERACGLYRDGVVDLRALAAQLGGVQLAAVTRALRRGGISVGYRPTVSSPPKPVVPQWGISGTRDAPAVKVEPQHYEYDVDPATLVAGVGGSRTRCQFIPGKPAGAATLYCGRPVAAGAYCAECAGICYKPRQAPAVPATLGPLPAR